MKDAFETWIARFSEEPIALHGDLYRLSCEELAGLYRYKGPPGRLTSNYWHPDGPSTWLTVSVFVLVRRKYPDLTEKDHLKVAGQVLRIDWKQVVKKIRWHEAYMSFHDGGACKVLEGLYE